MKKRVLSIILVLCMVMTLLPTTAWAADSDFTIENDEFTKYDESEGDIAVSNGAISIGNSVFDGVSTTGATNDDYGEVWLLGNYGYDSTTRKAVFYKCYYNEKHTLTARISKDIDESTIYQLQGKYVLVTHQDSIYSLIAPVKSQVDKLLSVNGDVAFFEEGKDISVSSNLNLSEFIGEIVLYHVYQNEIVSVDSLQKKAGYINAWSDTTKRITIDEIEYSTNYLSDLSFVNSLEQIIGTPITFYVSGVDGNVLKIISSLGPDVPDPVPVKEITVNFLGYWDELSHSIKFGDNESSPITYTVADSVDVSNIGSLLRKYVLVTMEQGDSSLEYTITDIQPVESKIGTVSATGEHSLTIDGTTYPVREDYVLALYDGKEVLYHVYNGTIMGCDVLEEKTGILAAWDEATGRVTIDETVYPTNFLSDVSKLSLAVGRKITYYLVNTTGYSPIMKYTVLNDVPCEQVTATICVGETATLAFDSFGITPSANENNVSVSVEDEAVLYVENTEYKSMDDGTLAVDYTVKAKHTGTTTVSVYVDDVAVKRWEIRVELDRWGFDNSYKYWSKDNGYYISKTDYHRLTKYVSPVEKGIITLKFLNKKEWTGSCNGMSKWVCLVASGVLPSETVNSKSLYSVNSVTPEIQSAINYYHVQQYLVDSIVREQTFMALSQPEQIEKLKEYATLANHGGNPILISFQWYDKFRDDGSCITTSPKSHAVVGYGLEDGSWIVPVNDQKLTYTHRVRIYDCSKVDSFYKFSDCDLYFTDDGTWCIPSWEILSKDGSANAKGNNGKLKLVTNDISHINAVDYITGNRSLFAPAENIIMFAEPGALYKIISGDSSYTISGFSVLESTENQKLNILLDDNIAADGERTPTTAMLMLPNANSDYSVVSEDSSMNFSLSYGKYLETAELDSPGSITFKPNGSLSVQATEATDYGLSITSNTGYTPLSWHTISFAGSNATEVSTESVTEGIILYSDNLTNVTVYGTDDNETKELKFSTQEDSVLITEKSDELVILIDTDNDGTYETPVEEETSKVTITFNANGGTVTPNKAAAGEDGKVSALPVPTRSGYTFDGWYTASSGGEKITTDYVFTSDTTVYAHWTKNSGGSSGGSSSGGGFSGGGSSNTSYSITTGNFAHGSVSVSPKSASKGTKVTITATPDTGYKLEKLAVTGNTGNELELTNKGDGTHTFIMPAGTVKVEASFVAIETAEAPWVNPFTDVAKKFPRNPTSCP